MRALFPDIFLPDSIADPGSAAKRHTPKMKRSFALFLILLFLFLLACLGSFSPQEGAGAFVFPPKLPIRNLCGSPGAACALFLFNALGYGAYVLLTPLLIVAVIYAWNGTIGWIPLRVFGFGLMLCIACATFALMGELEGSALPLGPGGYVGVTLKFVTSRYFSPTGCYIFFVSVFIGSLILTCDYAIMRIVLWCFGVMPIGNTLIEKITGTPQEPHISEPVQIQENLPGKPEPEPIFVPEIVDEPLENEIQSDENEEETVPDDDTTEETPREPEEETPKSRNPFASPVKEKFFPEFEKPQKEISYTFEPRDEDVDTEPFEDTDEDVPCEEFESFFENRNENEDESEDIPEEYDTTDEHRIPLFEEESCPAPTEEVRLEEVCSEETHVCTPAHAEIAEPNCPIFPRTCEPEPVLQVEPSSYGYDYEEAIYSDIALGSGVVYSDTLCYGGTLQYDSLVEEKPHDNPIVETTPEPEPLFEEMASTENDESESFENEDVFPEDVPLLEEPQILEKFEPVMESVAESPGDEEISDEIFQEEPVYDDNKEEEEQENENALDDETDEVDDEEPWYDEPAHEESPVYETLRIDYDHYLLPEIDLLTPSEPINYEKFESTLKKQAVLLEKAFKDFRCNIKVVEIQTGPVIAQFEIQLEQGLSVKKILGLTDDIAIALKVPSVRIVPSIPGKNTVGVEIPNESRQIVRLREVLEETTEIAKTMQIPLFLGKDVSGSPMVVDLAKLPHLLIAGQTGTGKSVCLNSIIMSILMARTPAEVRMIMIDPKTVEMGPYKTIPHLMLPVVTDMKKAEALLGWAVEKMEQRYELFAQAGVKQLSEYNALPEKVLFERMQPESEEEWNNLPHTMPYMVIIVDEVNDLMMTSGKEVENHIIRLGQKSRAAGIHLVLATQKPTVNVLSGLIKSNLPARIAFQVSSRSDSAVVLDSKGAEKLLGHGDMLFLRPGSSQLIRGQGTYVSNAEIETVVESIGTELQEFADELISLRGEGEEEGEDEIMVSGEDGFYLKCAEQIIREGRGSSSLLQRRFSIGYGRATRMVERMEKEGIVGPHNGSQAREVLVTLSEWRKRQAQRQSEPTEEVEAEAETETVTKKQYPVNPAAVPRNKPTKRDLVKAAARNNR